ncbi:MAG: GTPase ObgE [Planctomycetes bacterium]|nr:GTPase ObgE [Planctomycetota bacterium]
MFVDRCQIEFQAGRGGDGCMSFRRERYVPKGGPNGGDGGNGGSIIIEAREGVDHLSALAHRKTWRAPKGMHGEGSNKTGRKGEDLVIHVPPGTVVIDAKNDFVIRDLTTDGDSFVVARGGKGGRGNASFKSAQNRAPRQFTRGDDGEQRIVIFELKAIADVGLIGKPNAGKSTLLSRLSHARPEIANYPFTTKHPNLGRVQIDLDRSFVMADIPGLIEGAHEGVGLGHEFLRHVERAGVLVHLVEPVPMDGTDPLENYRSIREELTEYKVKLGERPELIVVTKSELPGANEIRDQLAEQSGETVYLISAVTGEGLNRLTGAIATRIQEEAAP